MIHFITYANSVFEKAKHRICNEAKNTGWFDTIKGYSPNDLSEEFRDKYDNILNNKRGAGYWIWKYDIISQTLQNINDGDFLIYADAGYTINKNGEKRFYEYINMLDDENPIVSFQNGHLEYKYTTKEIFKYFNVLDDDKITNTSQLVGGIFIMKKK